MFGTAALAQSASGPAATAQPSITDMLTQTGVPILLMIGIFWFLIFRPQQKRQRAQQDMLSKISRGDTVVTTGGIIGKVTKAVEGDDLEVEIAPGTRVKLVRGMVADVRSRANPAPEAKAS